MNQRSFTLYRNLILITDGVAALLAFFTATRLHPTPLTWQWTTPLLALVATLIGLWSFRGYDVRRVYRVTEESAIVLLGALLATGIFGGFLFFLDQSFPRRGVGYFALTLPLVLFVGRLIWRELFKARQVPRIPTERVLIVGADAAARAVGGQVQARDWLGLELVGYVDDQAPQTLGTLAELDAVIARERVEVIIVALPLEQSHVLPSLLERVQPLAVRVKLLPDLYPLTYLSHRMEMFGGMPLISIAEPVLSPWQAAVKRGGDIVVAALLLLLTAPLTLLISVAIRASSAGPVIYRQPRIGEQGQRFMLYKFRTMVDGADRMARPMHEADAIPHKQPHDPRVTPIGRWLRRFSLDELPNLLNVLRGEMSIVGPRPELPEIVAAYEPWQRKRLLVPQGITGWWQINGRSDRPMFYHTEDDLFYVRNYSLLLDLEILWKTLWVVLRGKGAY
ncbi:MAG: sugar transferase [Anaerolineales bacterium]|nr:sugar transferase [Anaerolineales bacterium]MCB9129158.1 sugar transferase [Ardenticatenales bacterium]